MKILGVVGSPRKNGNTHVLVEEILAGARDGGAETAILLLGNMAIRECDGCHVCWTGKECCKNDDMNGVYARIVESDVLVFGTPVYWYGPTALMKAFIDRFVYFNCPANRTQVRGRSAALAIPYEDESPDTVAPVVEFFRRCFDYLEMKLVGRIIVPGVTRRGEVSQKADRMAEAHELGRVLAAGC